MSNILIIDLSYVLCDTYTKLEGWFLKAFSQNKTIDYNIVNKKYPIELNICIDRLIKIHDSSTTNIIFYMNEFHDVNVFIENQYKQIIQHYIDNGGTFIQCKNKNMSSIFDIVSKHIKKHFTIIDYMKQIIIITNEHLYFNYNCDGICIYNVNNKKHWLPNREQYMFDMNYSIIYGNYTYDVLPIVKTKNNIDGDKHEKKYMKDKKALAVKLEQDPHFHKLYCENKEKIEWIMKNCVSSEERTNIINLYNNCIAKKTIKI